MTLITCGTDNASDLVQNHELKLGDTSTPLSQYKRGSIESKINTWYHRT